MHRLLLPALLVAAGLAVPAAADAVVLVNAPSHGVRCGGVIRTGVWYQSFSGGGRRATIQIRNGAGRVVQARRVTANAKGWQYFSYRPRCGGRYAVRYVTPNGTTRFHVYVHR